MEGYYIIKINARKILDHMQTLKDAKGKTQYLFKANLSDPFIYSAYVKSREKHSDFAAARQIILTAREVKNLEIDFNDPRAIEQFIVEMDFNDAFFRVEIKEESPIYKLLEVGVDITFPGHTEPTHFAAYDKSNSMARKKRIYFIDESIKDQLSQRLMLDIKCEQMPLSKLYSYRGLYYSDAKRINGLVLNEETVVVIADVKHIPRIAPDPDDPDSEEKDREPLKIPVFTNKVKDEEGNIVKDFGETEEEIELEPFDGAGLISPDYAQIINKELKNKANSFQIRLPFTKGMLHKADWQSLVKEIFVDRNIFPDERKQVAYEDLMIKDYADNLRNLSKIKIIIPVSMFKCNKWIKEYCKKNNIDDCMKYYFSMMKKYDHALYISGSDASIVGKSDSLLNYQLINPMQMEKETFKGLVEKHIKETERLRPENICSLSELEGNGSDAEKHELSSLLKLSDDEDLTDFEEHETEEEGENEAESEMEPDIVNSFWLRAVSKKPRLVYDPYIEGKLNNERENLARGIVRGRIMVESERRYLCPDLAAFVIHVIKQLEDYDSLINAKKFRQSWMSQTLFANSIFVPGMKKTDVKRVALFRNPHLSRNEECLAAVYNPSMKKGMYRFFKDLTGVVMIGRESFIAMTLGGADFDGDEVKIVTEPDVVNSIKKGLYGEGTYDLSERKVPLLNIKPEKPQDLEVKDSMNPNVICQTFTGSVGMISNKAIRIGFREYAGTDDEREKYKNGCATCSVLTGLDIDAAKSGKKPDLSILSKEYGISKGTIDDDYLAQKDILMKRSCRISLKNDKYVVSLSSSKDEQKNKKKSKKKSENKNGFSIKFPEDGTVISKANNELLPLLYAEYFVKDTDAEKANETERKELLKGAEIVDRVFGITDKNWRKDLEKNYPEQISCLNKVINDYLQAEEKAQKTLQAFRKPENNELSGKVYYMLERRYDSYEQMLGAGLTVEQALKNALASLRLAIETENDAEECIKRIEEELWVFTPEKQRLAKMCRIVDPDGTRHFKDKILPENPGTAELLTDFNIQNHALLEMLVRIVRDERKNQPDDEKPRGYYELDGNMFQDIYEESMSSKVLKKDFDESLKIACREKIAEIFECDTTDLSSAVRFAVAFRKKGTQGRRGKIDWSKDHEGEFMWSVFEPEEIINAIEG